MLKSQVRSSLPCTQTSMNHNTQYSTASSSAWISEVGWRLFNLPQSLAPCRPRRRRRGPSRRAPRSPIDRQNVDSKDQHKKQYLCKVLHPILNWNTIFEVLCQRCLTDWPAPAASSSPPASSSPLRRRLPPPPPSSRCSWPEKWTEIVKFIFFNITLNSCSDYWKV